MPQGPRACTIHVANDEYFLATNNSCQWTDLLPPVVALIETAFRLYLVFGDMFDIGLVPKRRKLIPSRLLSSYGEW